MKIRNDFVSNSSSSSFICYLNNHNGSTTKYSDKFDDLLKETIDSKKLFEYVILDNDMIEKLSQLIKDQINLCVTDDNSILETLNYHHNFKLDLSKYVACAFPDFLYQYMISAFKDQLKSLIVMFVTESCWDNNCGFDGEDRLDDLQTFLHNANIKYKTSEAWV